MSTETKLGLRRDHLAYVAAGGIFIGVLSTFLLSAMPMLVVALVFVALLSAVPTFAVKNAKLYWLAIFLFFLPIEQGKRITNLEYSSQYILETIGLPPSGLLGVKIFPTDLVMLALLGGWIVRLSARRERIYLHPVSYIAVAYLVWITFSVLQADHLQLALAQLVQEYKCFLIHLYVINEVRTRNAYRVVIYSLLMILGLEAVVTPTLHFLGFGQHPLLSTLGGYDFFLAEGAYSGRAGGTFGNATNLGMYIITLLPLPFMMIGFYPKVRYNLLLSVSLLLGGGLALFLSGARSPALGVAFGIGLCVLLLRYRNIISKRHFLLLLSAGTFAVLLALPILYKYLTARPESFVGRFILMETTLDLVAKNPIFGVGINNSTAARQGLYASLFPVHNHYLVLAAEAGVIGLALFVAFFTRCAYEGFARSRSPDAEICVLALAGMSVILSVGVNLCGDHFHGNATIVMLWFNAGLVLSLKRFEEAQHGKPTID